MPPPNHTLPAPVPGRARPIVGVFLLEPDAGAFYLSQRLPGSSGWVGSWQNAGGKVGPGEDCLDAAVREVAEETGLLLHREDLVLLGVEEVPDAPVSNLVHTFLAVLRPGQVPQPTEKTKSGEWVLFPLHSPLLERLPVVPGLKAGLKSLLTRLT